MSKIGDKIADMVEQHDTELLVEVQQTLLNRLEDYVAVDYIHKEAIRDEILDVFDEFLNK